MSGIEIVSQEYWAEKDGVRLFVFRKRPAELDGERPVLFLVHGSSLCARTGFDLEVPGRSGYSMMDWFAARGFDVWTMDHENYGRSDRTGSNSDIRSGAKDIAAAVPFVARESGQDVFHFFGSSSGALRAGLYAMEHPETVRSLTLDAFVWTGEGSPTLAKRRENLEHFRTHPTRDVDRAFFHSIFNRDRPGLVEPGVADAFADAELQYGTTMPTGTYLDMCENLPLVDPTRIACPVLMLRGEHDGIATEADLAGFFQNLTSDDKQMVVLPDQAHVGVLGVNRARFFHVLQAFLTLPERQAAVTDA
ncbi:MAG: alpha/beta hydrolase [Alphaproteobacteria bacterium]|nr:alpha/beta hydrolase [Alphaproteobacteria bacterium]|tara:strand:+ start:955 stop:1872 length:918 start_codon:yes stop_codon:yes gene_type:complete